MPHLMRTQAQFDERGASVEFERARDPRDASPKTVEASGLPESGYPCLRYDTRVTRRMDSAAAS